MAIATDRIPLPVCPCAFFYRVFICSPSSPAGIPKNAATKLWLVLSKQNDFAVLPIPECRYIDF